MHDQAVGETILHAGFRLKRCGKKNDYERNELCNTLQWFIHSLWFMTRATQHSRALVPIKQTTPTSRHQISQALFHILSLSFINVWVIENHHDWKVCWTNIAVYTMRMPHLAQDTFHLIIGHKWFICRGWFNCILLLLYIFTFYICTALKQSGLALFTMMQLKSSSSSIYHSSGR